MSDVRVPTAILFTLVFFLELRSVGADARFYERGSDVVPLKTTSDFKKHISNSSFLWVLQLYREGCGFCKLLEPEYDRAAADLKHVVYFAAIDVERHSKLAQSVQKKYSFKVEGVPTLKFLSPQTSIATDYRGERTAKALKAAAYKDMPSFVSSVRSADLDNWLERGPPDVRKAVLFSAKDAVTPLLKAMSSAYRNRIQFAQVTVADLARAPHAYAERFGIRRLPALVVMKRSADSLEDARWLKDKFGEQDFALLQWSEGEKPSFRKLEAWLMGYGRSPRSPRRTRKNSNSDL